MNSALLALSSPYCPQTLPPTLWLGQIFTPPILNCGISWAHVLLDIQLCPSQEDRAICLELWLFIWCQLCTAPSREHLHRFCHGANVLRGHLGEIPEHCCGMVIRQQVGKWTQVTWRRRSWDLGKRAGQESHGGVQLWAWRWMYLYWQSHTTSSRGRQYHSRIPPSSPRLHCESEVGLWKTLCFVVSVKMCCEVPLSKAAIRSFAIPPDHVLGALSVPLSSCARDRLSLIKISLPEESNAMIFLLYLHENQQMLAS